MNILRFIALGCAVIICLCAFASCNGIGTSNTTTTTTTTTGNDQPPPHVHSPDLDSIIVDTDAHTVEYACSCGEKETEAMQEKVYTINIDGVESTTTSNQLVIPTDASGDPNFIGMKYNGGTIYAPGVVITIAGDVTLTSVYKTNSHTHAYEKLDGSLEPTCSEVGVYKLKCNGCTGTKEEAIPALGHAFSSFATSGDGTMTARACFNCGVISKTGVFAPISNGTVLAFGDSMTYGTKLPDTTKAYSCLVADTLGYDVENIAHPGSEAYQWYSVLTGRDAPNGKSYDNVNGVYREDMIEKIKGADIILFTLGVNDICSYYEYRTSKQVCNAILGIIDVIHEENPDAKVVCNMFTYLPRYDGSPLNDTVKALLNSYFNLVREKLEKDKYCNFVYFVDITKITSNVNNFSDVPYPDYVHPGIVGHELIAKEILEYLNIKK